MASTYRWIGGTGAADNATNWALESGSGNPDGLPDAGDSAIVATGTVQLAADSSFSGNTIAIGGTAGVAALTLSGGTAIDLANPTVDAVTLITSGFSPAQTKAEASRIGIAGRFVNKGSITAIGPAGSVFTIDVQQDGTVPGLFANEGTVITSVGNTMSVVAGPNSEFVIGQFGTGIVSVGSTDATFIAVGGMAVGRAGVGRLFVGNDGTVSVEQDATGTLNAGTLTLGVGSATDKAQTGGSGSATIDSGGSLNVQSLLLIGGNGDQGTLAVNGGTVSVAGSLVAGVRTVIGGTTLAGTGTMTVGSGGLLRTTGTASASDTMVLGRDATAQGRVTVADGTLASTGRLVIGDRGTGDLTLNLGSAGSANGVAVGLSSGGFGTLTVAGGHFSSTGLIDVGIDGLGVVRVVSGGTLTSGSGGPIGARFGANNIGLGLIDGANALFSVDGGLVVGDQGIGTLNITNGAVVNAGTFAISLGNGSGGSGDVTVSGGDARLVGGALKIANAIGEDSFGTLTIETGGTVQVLSAAIGTGGVLNMQGGAARSADGLDRRGRDDHRLRHGGCDQPVQRGRDRRLRRPAGVFRQYQRQRHSDRRERRLPAGGRVPVRQRRQFRQWLRPVPVRADTRQQFRHRAEQSVHRRPDRLQLRCGSQHRGRRPRRFDPDPAAVRLSVLPVDRRRIRPRHRGWFHLQRKQRAVYHRNRLLRSGHAH
jgi:T5SS/PEP-CTERM-associated repeat protein